MQHRKPYVSDLRQQSAPTGRSAAQCQSARTVPDRCYARRMRISYRRENVSLRRANTSLRLFHPGSGSPMTPIDAYGFTDPRTAVPGTARATGSGATRAPEDTGADEPDANRAEAPTPAGSPVLSAPARFVATRKAMGNSAPAVLVTRGASETSRTFISLLERLLPIIRTGGATESRVAAAIISRVTCTGSGSFCGIHRSVAGSAEFRSAARP